MKLHSKIMASFIINYLHPFYYSYNHIFKIELLTISINSENKYIYSVKKYEQYVKNGEKRTGYIKLFKTYETDLNL